MDSHDLVQTNGRYGQSVCHLSVWPWIKTTVILLSHVPSGAEICWVQISLRQGDAQGVVAERINDGNKVASGHVFTDWRKALSLFESPVPE